MLHKFKHYVFPENPLDTRMVARFKRGAIHYAQVHSWWPVAPVQRWIRNHRFQFRHGQNGNTTHLKVSGADITHLWVADEVLLEGVYQLDVVPFTPDVVLDLGANIGLFTLLAARRWPQAHLVCVEPHPTTFSFLCDNLALNGVNAVKLQCAVDAEVGVKFLENDGAVFQTLSQRASATPVMTLQLDSLVPSRQDLKLLVKMDIEGSEVAVLDHLSARLPENTFVFIELHHGDESLRWIQDWAEKNAFRFSAVRRREDAIDGYLIRDSTSVTGVQRGAAFSSARRSTALECPAPVASAAGRGGDTIALPVQSQESIVPAAPMISSV
ncbi:MAG TPA: FkbM family methyltransferase [Verrucomicrobiae bacterium]